MDYGVLILILVVAILVFARIIFSKKYTISVSDLKALLSNMNESRLINVTASGPNNSVFSYMIYPIDIITCYDKKGNTAILKNNPGLEIQFTDMENKKKSFYFDTIRIQENIVSGNPSRFICSLTKAVDLNKVIKIELRNIKKGFKYKGSPFSK